MNIRYLSVLTAACLFTLPVFAQPLAHSILWRISSKDGHHTSYLYGSMHLTDDRIFDLGDSLYAAIQNSDGLATELDPTDLLSLAVQEGAEQEINGKNIKDMLSAKDYKTYAPLLAKKLNKPAGSITTRDILNQKNKWLQERYARGGMSTFLDMYLYEVARRQKKWTGGIEDADDQRGLLRADESVDKSDVVDVVGTGRDGAISADVEKMISVYLSQDLGAIDSLFGDMADKESVLLKRNRKMASRMDSLSGVRSMVFVVGVAHLPGEGGVIDLLRRKGFDVQPVFSSRKIKPREYPLPELSQNWEPVQDENGLYRVSMPGKPQDIEVLNVVRMKMYFDFLDLDGYCVMAIHSSVEKNKTDSLLDAVADRIFEGESRHTYEHVTINGARGRLYTSAAAADLEYKKGYLLAKDDIIYMAYGLAVKGDDKNKKTIDRFLKSFEVPDRKKTDSGLAHMVVLTDSAMAFTIATPTEAKLTNNARTPNGHSRLYISADVVNGGYYFFGANEVAPGRYILDDSAFFQQLFKSVSGKIKKIDFDSSWVAGDQLVTEIHGQVVNADVEMRLRYIDRGNRWYALVAMNPASDDSARAVRFFSSFAELDYPAHTWGTATAPDSGFATWTPAPFQLIPKDSSDKDEDVVLQCTSFDSSRAQGYSVVSYRLSPYYWSNSDSAFWADRIDAHVKYSDTLISKKAISNGDAKGWEWIQRGKRSHNYERYRTLLNGDELYSLFDAGPYQELHTANADRFFGDFRFSHPIHPGTYFQSKAQRLITDLLSADSATAAGAKAFMHQAPFTREDLPLLHQALLHPSPLRTDSTWPSTVNDAIFSAIVRTKDSSSFRFAMDHYRDVPDSVAFIKNNLLDLMAVFRDSLRYRIMAQYLVTPAPRYPLDDYFFEQLQDSLALTATIVPELLPLLKDSVVLSGFATTILQLLDSGLLHQEQLLPYRDDIMGYTRKLARRLAVDKDDWHYEDKQMIRLCARFNEKAGNALMRQLLHIKDASIALAALDGLLANKQPIDTALLRFIAADKTERLNLFRSLEKAGRTNLFPGAYKTAKALGQSEVFEYLNDDDDLDASTPITFVTARTITTPRGKRTVMFYKYTTGEATYLACAGPYDPQPGKLSTDDIYVEVDNEEFDPGKLAQQIGALLKLLGNEKTAQP
jgi:uncharacterized protein YbaP (TraB family)